jgi:luciferase family oxidoreductase group 1
VLLNHYSPFKVAEMFQQLEAMLPGRVDLGLGRATSGPVIDAALRADRRSRPVDDHAERVAEVLAWLRNAFPEGHPFHGHPLMPSIPNVPEPWLLGSSPGGFALAAALGIGYTFTAFINPQAATDALQHFRHSYRRTGHGSTEPRAMLAVDVSVGEDAARRRSVRDWAPRPGPRRCTSSGPVRRRPRTTSRCAERSGRSSSTEHRPFGMPTARPR